jgi:hypothetical protein
MVHRPTHPPAPEYFDAERPAFGTRTVTVRLEPLDIELRGLDDALADMLYERYSPFAVDGPGKPNALKVEVRQEAQEHFMPPADEMEFVQMRIACDGTRVRYMSYQVAGWFDIRGGEGLLLLTTGEWEPRQRSFENYVRAAVAWQAAGRGGALVHAASAVHDGKGYLFYGESGAGKSTLSECNRRGQVLSDDLSLVLRADDGTLDVVGTPFRGTYEGGPVIQGRFPLAAGFRLIQSPTAEVKKVDRLRAYSELIGNLPFVAEAFSDRTDIFADTMAGFAQLPLAHLHFRKDDSYWDAIHDAGF